MKPWKELLPLAWEYKPDPALFASPGTYRAALTEHAQAAAADLVARRVPQPKGNGEPLFIAPDPWGLNWAMADPDRKRRLWATWLRGEWLAEGFPEVQAASAERLSTAGRVQREQFEKIPMGLALGLPGGLLVLGLLGGLYLAARR